MRVLEYEDDLVGTKRIKVTQSDNIVHADKVNWTHNRIEVPKFYPSQNPHWGSAKPKFNQDA